MNTPKCRCSGCNTLVDKWINDLCFSCYELSIKAPLNKKIVQLLDKQAFYQSQASISFRESLAYSYRWEVKLVDWFSAVFFFIRYMLAGAQKKYLTVPSIEDSSFWKVNYFWRTVQLFNVKSLIATRSDRTYG